MSENKAYVLLIVGGVMAEIAIYLGFSAIGGSARVFMVLTMLCLIATSFLVGVIGVHYERRDDQKDR